MKVMPTPRSVDIAITGRCNLACAYCFYADEMVSLSDLPTARWLSFFDELGRLGVMSVCLTGGEVFTRPDLFELIDGVIANHMRYQLLTNGTLITAETLEKFAIGKRRLRLNSIQVSVDGSCAEINDQSRPGSFERSIRGLRLLKLAGFPLTVRVTVNRFNFKDLENVAHFLLEDIGINELSVNEAYACGATNRFTAGIMLEPVQRQQAACTLLKLTEQYPGRISAQAGPLALATEAAAIRKAMADGKKSKPGGGTLSACGGVFSQIAVLHDGSIVPCHNLGSFQLGNITSHDLSDLWQTHPTLEALRQRYTISLDTVSTCKSCDYEAFCTGGCPGGAFFLTGKLNGRNPMDCHRIFTGEEEYLFSGSRSDSAYQAQHEENHA